MKGGVWYVNGCEPVWQDIAQQSQYLFIESEFSQNDRLVTERGGRRYPSAFKTVALKVISQEPGAQSSSTRYNLGCAANLPGLVGPSLQSPISTPGKGFSGILV